MKAINGFFISGILFTMLCMSSCTMEKTTHFNDDFGGSQIVSVNAQEIMDLMSSFGQGQSGEMDNMMSRFNDPAFADSLAMMEDSLSAIFNGTGAKNFTVAFSEMGEMSMGYEFESLATFENMKRVGTDMSSDIGGGIGGGGMEALSGMLGGDYSKKGSWLTIPISNGGMLEDLKDSFPTDGSMGDESMDDTMAMLEGFMGGSVMFKNVFTFDKTIKKIKTNIPYKQMDNKLIISYSMSDMVDWGKKKEKPFLKVKLK